MKQTLIPLMASMALIGSASLAHSADILNPTPVAQQQPAVDGLNFELSVLGGSLQRNVLGAASNAMFTTSIATPIPFFSESFGAQVDLGAGVYDGDFTSAAAGLHLFWRDPSRGAIGIYGDWGYVDPEHAGRVGAEVSVYNGQWSLDVFAGMQFGQHVFTEFVDEVDLSYYYNDNTRVSVGHRLTSRGHVANLSFEHMLDEGQMQGWSVFGEIEGGEDNYVGGFGGLRYAFGNQGSSTLIERDRQSSLTVRIPRNLLSVSQCGQLDTPRPATSLRSTMTSLCASEDEINRDSTAGISKIR